jgi:hypothetical protein
MSYGCTIGVRRLHPDEFSRSSDHQLNRSGMNGGAGGVSEAFERVKISNQETSHQAIATGGQQVLEIFPTPLSPTLLRRSSSKQHTRPADLRS